MEDIPETIRGDIGFSSRGSVVQNARRAINDNGKVRWLDRDGRPGDVVVGRHKFIVLESGELYLYPTHSSEDEVEGEAVEKSPAQNLERAVENIVDSLFDNYEFPRGKWIADMEEEASQVDPNKEWMKSLLSNLVEPDELLGVDLTDARAVGSLVINAMKKAPAEKSVAMDSHGIIDYDHYREGRAIELDPRTQRTSSSQLSMFYHDRNFEVPAKRKRGIEHLFKDVVHEPAQRTSTLDESSRRSSASSSSDISMAQFDEADNLPECSSQCWLRQVETDCDGYDAKLSTQVPLAKPFSEAAFRYTCLTETQFRLLELQPAKDDDDTVWCSLTVAELPTEPTDNDESDQISYDALSYT